MLTVSCPSFIWSSSTIKTFAIGPYSFWRSIPRPAGGGAAVAANSPPRSSSGTAASPEPCRDSEGGSTSDLLDAHQVLLGVQWRRTSLVEASQRRCPSVLGR